MSLQFTEEQQQILDYVERSVPATRPSLLVEGVAGAGKTTLLVAIHKKLIERNIGVLALTHSQSGSSRYNTILNEFGAVKVDPAQQGRTMDGFSLGCLSLFSRKKRWERGAYGNGKDHGAEAIAAMQKVIDDFNECRAFEHGAGDTLPFDTLSILEYLDLVANIKTSLLFQENFEHLEYEEMSDLDVEDMQYFLEGMGLPLYSYSLYKRYENLREGREFSRLGDASFDLAKEPDAVRRYVNAHKIQVVLLDEFHDTRPAQYAIIEALRDAGCAIVAVGDEGQDIFSWRGVTPFSAFSRFKSNVGIRLMPLSRSFRLGRPLAPAVSKVLSQALRDRIFITPAGHHSAIEFVPGAAPATVIAREIATLPDGIRSANLLTAIFPSVQMAFGLMMDLCDRGIFYCTHHIMPLHHSREALLARAIVLIYGWGEHEYNGPDVEAILKFLELPIFDADSFGLTQVQANLRELNEATGKVKYHLVNGIPSAIEYIHKRIGYAPTACVATNIAAIAAKLKINTWLSTKTIVAADGVDSINSFQSLCAKIAELGGRGFIQLLERNAAHYENGVNRADVRITTVLHAKGQEWSTVVLPIRDGASGWKGHFRGSDQFMKRQLYVAMSRAKGKLLLCSDAAEDKAMYGL